MMTDKDTLKWAARWIEESLVSETDERVVAFGKNMAMTLRAAALPSSSEFPAPQVEGAQTWCDHCSADLNGVKHILCERCYREYTGPRWFDPEFNPAPQPTPADEERHVTRHVLWDWKGVESLSMPELDELVKRIATALTEARRAQGTCTWSLSGTRQWSSQCGDISHHRDGDYCCFCGKLLVEATKGEQ